MTKNDILQILQILWSTILVIFFSFEFTDSSFLQIL